MVSTGTATVNTRLGLVHSNGCAQRYRYDDANSNLYPTLAYSTYSALFCLYSRYSRRSLRASCCSYRSRMHFTPRVLATHKYSISYAQRYRSTMCHNRYFYDITGISSSDHQTGNKNYQHSNECCSDGVTKRMRHP